MMPSPYAPSRRAKQAAPDAAVLTAAVPAGYPLDVDRAVAALRRHIRAAGSETISFADRRLLK